MITAVMLNRSMKGPAVPDKDTSRIWMVGAMGAASLAPIPSHSPDGHCDALNLEEYRSLRQESSAAKANQQTILQWTLAAAGVVIAAAVAVTRPVAGGVDISSSYIAVEFALLILVPLLILCGLGVWVGEIERMERVGRFLRIRERQTWPSEKVILKDFESQPILPIMWENIIYTGDAELQLEYGKNRFGSAAAVGLFLGVYFTSTCVSLWLAWKRHVNPATGPASPVWVSVYAGIIFLLTITVFGWRLRSISKMSKGSISLDSSAGGTGRNV